jgi:Flp pilus assembly protein TadG
VKTILDILRRFASDVRGAPAVEFAFIAPILIVFYLGMAEVCQLLKAKRRVDHAGSAIADLITQEQAVTPARLADLKSISASILQPLPDAPLVVQIYSVSKNSSGALACEFGWPTACTKGAAPPIPVATPLNNGEGVIVADVNYTYTSRIGYFIAGGRALKHRAELRPRRNDVIACVGC